jgi:hypothetical protein
MAAVITIALGLQAERIDKLENENAMQREALMSCTKEHAQMLYYLERCTMTLRECIDTLEPDAHPTEQEGSSL